MHIDILVDSRCRNKEVDASPGEYCIGSKMNLDFEFVESVQIVNPSIPFSRPLINNLCNQMHVIDFFGKDHSIYIPNGDYKKDPIVLCEAINSELIKIKEQDIKAEYNGNTCKYRITSNKDFGVVWEDHPKLARMLGFENTTYISNLDFLCGRFVITTQFIHNLDGDSCIKLIISELSAYPLCVATRNSVICPEIPIGSLVDKQLKCCFLDEDDCLYDFQNYNNNFMIRLKLSSHM